MDMRFQEEQEKHISDFLANLKFRKQVFGGVRETDVWKKIGKLNDMYRQALIAERARYDALLRAKTESGGGEATDEA